MFVLCPVAAVRHFVRSHLEDPQLSFYLCKCHFIFPLINHDLINRRNASQLLCQGWPENNDSSLFKSCS